MDLQCLTTAVVLNLIYLIVAIQGQHLIATTIIQEPYLYEKSNSGGVTVYQGYIKDLLDRLSRDVGFTYELIPVSDGQFGKHFENGSWSGTVGEIIEKRADMIAAPVTITPKRVNVIEFSYPFQTVSLAMVLKRPDEVRMPVEDRLRRVFEPFESLVWLLIIAAYFVISSAIYVISYFNPYDWRKMAHEGEASIREGESFTCMNSFWFSLSAMTLQGYIRTPRSLGGRLVVAVWWLFVVVTISCYISKLTTLLQVRPNEKEIEGYLKLQGLEDVLNENLKFVVLEGSATEMFLQHNTLQEHVKLLHGELLSDGNGEYVSSIQQGIEELNNYPPGKKTLITESLMIKYHTQKKGCQFYYVNVNSMKRQYSFGFPIGSNMTEIVGRHIVNYNEQGFLTYLNNKWFTGTCNEFIFESTEEKYKVQEFHRLDAVSFSGILLAVAVGILAGVLVTIVECIVFKWAESGEKGNRETTRNQDGVDVSSSLLSQTKDKEDTQV